MPHGGTLITHPVLPGDPGHALYAGRQRDEPIQRAAEVIGHDLQRQLTGRRISDREIRRSTQLGEMLVETSSTLVDGCISPSRS